MSTPVLAIRCFNLSDKFIRFWFLRGDMESSQTHKSPVRSDSRSASILEIVLGRELDFDAVEHSITAYAKKHNLSPVIKQQYNFLPVGYYFLASKRFGYKGKSYCKEDIDLNNGLRITLNIELELVTEDIVTVHKRLPIDRFYITPQVNKPGTLAALNENVKKFAKDLGDYLQDNLISRPKK